MRADGPSEIKLVLDMNSAGGRAELAFVDLLHTITTEPANRYHHEHEFWADLEARPELRRSFDAQMNRRFRIQASQIAEGYDWDRLPESSMWVGATAPFSQRS